MKVKLIVDGGGMKPGPAVAQQLGPMGINLGKVISDVNAATSSFKGVKVPVELDVDPKTKTYTIAVFSPPVAELIKKELGLEKGSGEPHKIKMGNIAIETLIGIAKQKMPNLLAKNLKSAVKLIVGSCVSLGILIENKEAKEIEKDIDAGVFDKEIKTEKTSVSEEKKKNLAEYYTQVKSKQEQQKKAEEEAKAAEDAAKEAAKVVAGAAGAAPAAGATAATPAAGTTAATKAPEAAKAGEKKEEAKKEAKKK